jgi:hypothetical protein
MTALVVASSAQTNETVESAANAYFAAMKSGDWAKCAALMHPEALASMKRSFALVVNADKSEDAARMIFGLKGNAEFAQLSGAEVFEKLMSFITVASPDLKAALSTATSAVLGQVGEGDDVAHVVYRTQIKVAGAEVSQVDLMSFKKNGSTWRALLTGDMEKMFQQLAQGMAGQNE